MNSRQCKALLLDYLEGELSPKLQAQVEDALNRFPECQEELAALRETRTMVADAPLPGDGPTEPYWDAFETRVLAHTRDAAPSRRRLVPWLAPIGLATATATLIFTVSAIAPNTPPPVDTEIRTTYVVPLSTEHAEEFTAAGDLDWVDATQVIASLEDDALDTAPLELAQDAALQEWFAVLSDDDISAEADLYAELDMLDTDGLDALLLRLDALPS